MEYDLVVRKIVTKSVHICIEGRKIMFRKLNLLVIFLTEIYCVSHAQDIGSGILCDGIECPKGTKVCLVRKDSIPNTDQMTVERTCKSGDGWLFTDFFFSFNVDSSFYFISRTKFLFGCSNFTKS